jgi:hypothetical protein
MSTVELRMNITNIQGARSAFSAVNGDVAKFAKALKESNLSARDQVLLWRQINKETNEAQRHALGITQELERARGKGKLFEATMRGAAAGAAALVSEAKNLAGVKGPAELKKGAEDLELALFNARKSMALTKDQWAKMGGDNGIEQAAEKSGYAVIKLAEEFQKVQEELSVGEQLLTNQGRLLESNAKSAKAMGTNFADLTRLQEQAHNQFNFGKTPEEIAKGKEIFTAGIMQMGLQGSITPENAPAFISSMADFKAGTGKGGVAGSLAFMARANAVKDELSISAPEAATRARSFFSEMANPKTAKRFQKTVGHSAFDKEGHFDDVAMADDLLKLKQTKGDRAYAVAMADIFRNVRSRGWMSGLVHSREFRGGTGKQIEALANPDIGAGRSVIDMLAQDFLGLRSTKGTIRENIEFRQRLQNGDTIDPILADIEQKHGDFDSKYPTLSGLMGGAKQLVAPALMLLASNKGARDAVLRGAGGALGAAGGAVFLEGEEAGRYAPKSASQQAQDREQIAASLKKQIAEAEAPGAGGWLARNLGGQDPERLKAELASVMGGKPGGPTMPQSAVFVMNVAKVELQDGAPAKIVGEATSSKGKAEGGGQRPKLPGRN